MASRMSSSAALKGKVALVTGGSSGLGRSIAQAYAQAGAYVVSADITAYPPHMPIFERRNRGIDLRTPTVELINSRWPSPKSGISRANFFKCDVSSEDDVARTVNHVVETYGRLDILANNAGIAIENIDRFRTGRVTRMHEMDTSILERIMAVNVRGAWLATKYAVKQFLSQSPHDSGDRGWIINTASILGAVGSAGSTCYCTSKGAVLQLTRATALEYAEDKIHVNAVLPGFTESYMLEAMYDKDVEEKLSQIISSQQPWATIGKPEDVASAFVFLAGDGARWVTGIGLPVDGGYLAR